MQKMKKRVNRESAETQKKQLTEKMIGLRN